MYKKLRLCWYCLSELVNAMLVTSRVKQQGVQASHNLPYLRCYKWTFYCRQASWMVILKSWSLNFTGTGHRWVIVPIFLSSLTAAVIVFVRILEILGRHYLSSWHDNQWRAWVLEIQNAGVQGRAGILGSWICQVSLVISCFLPCIQLAAWLNWVYYPGPQTLGRRNPRRV